MKKPAAKTRSKTVKRASTPAARKSARSTSMWQKYCRERDSFYQCHPNVQWLLAILIILFLVYLALMFTPTLSYGFAAF